MPVTLLKLFIAIVIGALLIHTFDLKLTALVDDITAWHYLALAAGIPLTLSAFFPPIAGRYSCDSTRLTKH